MTFSEDKISKSKLIFYWIAAWTSLGVLQTIRLYFAYDISNRDLVSWQKALIWGFGEWYLWGLLSLVLLKIIRWLDRQKSLKLKLLYFFSGLIVVPALYMYLYAAFWFATREIYPAQIGTSFSTVYEFFIANYVLKVNDNTVAYFLIVAAIYAFTYYKRLFQEQQQLAKVNELLITAKLEQLKTQLQPHFLFNTLNSITALIHSDPNRADLMTTKLSDLLRISLDSEKKQKVMLSEEISFLEKYIDIQKIRFEDRMNVVLSIDEKTKQALVPSLILQPIVENSIKHSVAKSSEKIHISITTARVKNRLIIEIANSGKSLPADFKNSIQERTGLQNSMERLNQMYRNQATLLIENNKPSGVIVKLSLPCQFKEDEK